MSESAEVPLGGERLFPEWVPAHLDTSVATPARMYDAYIGGKDNFPADRAAVEEVLRAVPAVRKIALANRAFLGRAVRHVAEQGIGQFLDVGIGMPGPAGTAETALSVRPDARIVGVDNDVSVLAHARAQGAEPAPRLVTVVEGDARDPSAILAHPQVREALDFGRPIAVLLIAVLHFVTDDEDPYGIVRTLMDAAAPGSYLAITHVTGDFDPERMDAAGKAYDKSTAKLAHRSRKEVEAFFDGLELLDPGVVLMPYWRPDGVVQDDADEIWMYGAVARKL